MGHKDFVNGIQVGKSDTANNGDITSLLLSFKNFANGRLAFGQERSADERRVIQNFISIATHYEKIEPEIMRILEEVEQEHSTKMVSQRN